MARRANRRRSRTAASAILASAAVAGIHRPVITKELATLPPVGQAQSFGSQTRSTSRFDIPPGLLKDVLAAFEHATGVTVTLSVKGADTLPSNGVSGVLTNAEALAALLAGTGLTSRFVSATEAVLDFPAVQQSVDVVGHSTVIESPKYPVPLRSVPQTIQVISQEAMQQQAVTTLSDALRNVPGITLQAGEGGGASNTAGDMFNMRGFNASNSLFVDGVRDDGLISRDVFNLEQVEVFMGPTGSDVGRGTAAGYINMDTKTPHLEPLANASLSLGSADQKRVAIDFNHQLSLRGRDTWLGKSAVRLNALMQDNGVPGRDEVELKSKAIAPSLALGLGTPTRVTASSQFVEQDNVPDYGIPGAAWLDEPLTPTTVRAPAPVDQRNYYGSPASDYDHASQASATARVEHDLGPSLTLRNQTRYNHAHREAVITTIQNPASYDAATDLVTLARQGNDRRNEILSNQTSLSSRFHTGQWRHAASAGLEYTHEEQFAPTLVNLGTRAPVDIFDPDPNDPVIGYAPVHNGAGSKGSTNTVALYGFDVVDLTDRWQLSGGLRWEYYDTSFLAVDATSAVTTDQSARDGVVSGKAGLLYKATQNGNVYFGYGTSVTPPGTANFTLSTQPNNQNNPNVKPQQSTNYEIGSKWDFANGRISLNTAVFHTVNENVIFTVDATAVPPIYNQDDGQRVNGISLGAVGRITDRWDLLANFGYLDTALRSQNPANDGKRLTLTPEWSGSVWTTYRLPKGFTFGGGLRATDKVYINQANTIHSPGYHLIDALAEYAVNTHLSLRLNVSNITNETYIRNVNNNGGRYNPGNPRAALVTTRVAF